MTLDTEAVGREVERRLRADCGGGWMLSTHTRRLLAEAVDVGMSEAGLHWREYVEYPDGFKRAARTIVVGVVVFLMGLLPIAISRLPSERNPDSERWRHSGTRVIGAWVFIALGPVLVVTGLARVLW